LKNFKSKNFLYGACYYHEYHLNERVASDFQLMEKAGLSVIRVGESVWSLWEPSENSFNLDWLQPILDESNKKGIRVIVGTPTYAIPPWLARKHPEIIIERTTGNPIPFGHRQNVNYSHPNFLPYAERIIKKIVERYKDHPAIIGWQVDNEPGLELSHDEDTFSRFKEYLRSKYKNVEKLNQEWGLVYWSHQISDWDDLWVPDGNTDPTYNQEWRTFHAELTKNYIEWQAGIVRALVPKSQFVTTCLDLGRAGTDDVEIVKTLDVASINVYYSTQGGLIYPQPEKIQGGTPWTARHSGPGLVYLLANMGRGLKQENFFVTETNATSLGHPPFLGIFPPYPGQLKQVAIALISRGAEMVEYWHWHSIPFGHESYWGGILPHSLEPGRTYESFVEISSLIRKLEPDLLPLTPVSEVAVLISAESRWALEFQPAIRNESSGVPLGDRETYRKILNIFTDLFYAADLHTNFFAESQLPKEPAELLENYPIFLLPGYFIANDEILKYATEYVRLGGHLVVTPRTGYANKSGRINISVMPGVLREVLGLRYEEFSHLTLPLEVDIFSANGAQATHWVDGLISEGAETLARYKHEFFNRFPAVTTNKFGKGRATYVGTIPNYEFSDALARWFRESDNFAPIPKSLRKSVRTNSAVCKDGSRVHFVFNWDSTAAIVTLPFKSISLINNLEFPAGGSCELGPWGIEIIKEL
jgi:beta-galactosidase